MKNKDMVYRLVFAFIFIIVLLGSVKAADPGHGAAVIGAGTFESGNYLFPNNLTVGGNNFFVNNGTGRVGIGTTSPSSLFDVSGYIRSSGDSGVATTGEGVEVVYTGGIGYMQSYNRTGTAYLPLILRGDDLILQEGSTEIMRVAGGNVGIGTHDPGAKLDINSTSDQLRLSYGPTTFANFTVSSLGDLYISSTGSSGDEIDFWYDADATRYVDIGQDSSGASNFRMFDDTAVDILLTTSGDSYINTGGDVGIGSDSPEGKLFIEKDTANVWGDESNYSIKIEDGSNDVGLLLGVSSTRDESAIQSMDPGTGWTTRPLILQPKSGNVGIGLSDPNYSLHVAGDIYLTGFDLLFSDAGSSNIDYITYNDTNFESSGGTFIFHSDRAHTSGLFAPTAGIAAENAYFLSNVGIGTDDPNDIFTIAKQNTGGDVGIRVQNLDTNDASTASIKFGVSTHQGYNSSEIQAIRNPNSLIFYTDGTERMRIDGNDAGGAINASGNNIINLADPSNDQDAATKAYVDAVNGSASGGDDWNVSGTNLFPKSLAYEVGIGTNDPRSMLDVDGNATIDSTLVINADAANTGDIYFTDGTAYSANRSWFISGTAGLKGRLVNYNPDFSQGTYQYTVYNNAADGSVTHDIFSDVDSPSTSRKVLNISYNGSGSPTPGFGGFYVALENCSLSETNSDCYLLGNRYVYRIWAKIPAYRNLTWASNAYGAGGTVRWLTPVMGTGEWEQYILVQKIGVSGSLYTTGFFYILDGADEAFEWHVASFEVIAVDEPATVEQSKTLNIGYKQNVNLSSGELVTTGNTYLASDSGDVGIGTTSPRSPLDVTGAISTTGETGLPSSGTGLEITYQTSSDRGRIIAFNRSGSAYKTLDLNDNVYISGGATGDVGIGSVAPGARLDVNQTGEGLILRLYSDTKRLTTRYEDDINAFTTYGWDEVNSAYVNISFGSADSDALFIDPVLKRVGIGTVTPSNRLDVRGDINASGEIYVNNGTAVSPWLYNQTEASSAVDNWNVSGTDLFPKSIAYNVGIGISSPDTVLHVQGDTAPLVKITRASDQNANILFNNTVRYLYAGMNPYGDFGIGSAADLSSAEFIFNVSSGGMGIGIASPKADSKLHVDGNLTIGTDDGVSYLIKGNANGGAIQIQANSATTDRFLKLGSVDNNGVFTSRLDILNPGNVDISSNLNVTTSLGVGTPSSSSAGRINANEHIFAGQNVYAAGTQGFVYGTSTTEGEYIYRSGNDIITYAGGNIVLTVDGDESRVGVGTTTPDGKLEVKDGPIAVFNDSVRHYRNVIHYSDNSATVYGTMKITMAKNWSSTMMQIKMLGYQYGGNIGTWELILGGYNYEPSQTWHNYNAEIRGRAPFYEVRYAYDGERNIILLGNTSTVWNYPKIVITDFVAGYSNWNDWGVNWSITNITDESSLDKFYNLTIHKYMAPSGNLGINTTNPASLLTVEGGQLNMTGNRIINVADPSDDQDAATKAYVDAVNGSASGGDDWNVSGTDLFPKSLAYNVGIGTTSPNATLQVGDSYSTKGGQVMRISSGALTANDVTNVLHIDSQSGDWNYTTGAAIELGYKHPTFNEYTSRIVHYGDEVTTRASKLQLQTHSSSDGVWNTGMLIDDTGQVGIGTTSPQAELNIKGADTVDDTVLVLEKDASWGNGEHLAIDWAGTGGTANVARIAAERVDASNYRLDFYVSDDGASSITNYMSILGGGNVGIGTDSPEAKLHVNYSADGEIIFSSMNSGADMNITIGYPGYGWYWKYVGSGGALANELQLWSEGAGSTDNQAYGITQDGNVTFSQSTYLLGDKIGVGTSAPTAKLELNGTSSDELKLHNPDSADTPKLHFDGSSSDSYIYQDSNSDLRFETESHADTFFIDNSGLIGIGTITPKEKFDIVDATPLITAWQTFTLRSNDAVAADKGGTIGFGGQFNSDGANATWAGIAGFKEAAASGNTAGYLSFRTRQNGASLAEKVRITSSGRVGINTTNPSAMLHVNSTSTTTGLIVEAGASGSPIAEFIRKAGASTKIELMGGNGEPQIVFNTGAAAGTDQYAIGYDTGGGFSIAEGGAIGTNDRFYIEDGGQVGIGTTSPTEELDVAGDIVVNNTIKVAVSANDLVINATDGSGNVVIILG